jgi:MFS family permease
VQLVLGIFLVGFMGVITASVAPMMTRTTSPSPQSAHFTGTPEQAQLILSLFGAVIMFGLASVISGVWQIKTGRRNKWIFIVMIGMTALLIGLGWLTTNKLG